METAERMAGYINHDVVKRPFRRVLTAAGLPEIQLHDMRTASPASSS